MLPEGGAHEALEEWEDEFVKRIFESTLTILSKLQQVKDEDLGKLEWLDHSATGSTQIKYHMNIFSPFDFSSKNEKLKPYTNIFIDIWVITWMVIP